MTPFVRRRRPVTPPLDCGCRPSADMVRGRSPGRSYNRRRPSPPTDSDTDADTETDYNVVMANHPTSVRFRSDVVRRLEEWVAAHDGSSLSSATNLLVDEALRMDQHRDIVFRAGPTGRRAGLAGGPDVWEVIRSVRTARAAEPDAPEPDVIDVVAANSSLPHRMVRAAIDYWSAYPEEIDAEIDANDEAERRAAEMIRRERELLGHA